MPIFHHAKAWEEYGIEYAVHKELWRNCVFAALGPQPDKGAIARDLSDRRKHGTLTNGPTWSNHSYRGRTFRALTLDGSDDCVVTPVTDALGPITLSAWVQPTGTTDYQTIYHNNKAGAVEAKTQWDLRSGNQMRWGHYVVGVGWKSWQTASTISAGAWHHVAVVYDEVSVARLYFDGILQPLGASSAAYVRSTAGRPFAISADYDGTGYNFPGSIAAVHHWSKALTDSQISIISRHPLAAYEVRLPEYFFGAPTAVTLTVAGSAVDVTSDSPTLTQHNTLAVGNAVCSVTSGNVALVQHSALTVQSSQLATSSQSPALTQHNALTVADSKCVVSSETLALTQHSALTVQGSVCAVTAGNIALTQHAALSVQSAACSITAENLTLTAHAPAHVALTVAGSKCSVTSGAVSLTQHNVMAVAASACVVSSGNVTLAYHAAGVGAIVEHQTLLLAI